MSPVTRRSTGPQRSEASHVTRVTFTIKFAGPLAQGVLDPLRPAWVFFFNIVPRAWGAPEARPGERCFLFRSPFVRLSKVGERRASIIGV